MSRIHEKLGNSKVKKYKKTQTWNVISEKYKGEFRDRALAKGYVNIAFIPTATLGYVKITGIPAYQLKEIKRDMRGEGIKKFLDNQLELPLFRERG